MKPLWLTFASLAALDLRQKLSPRIIDAAHARCSIICLRLCKSLQGIFELDIFRPGLLVLQFWDDLGTLLQCNFSMFFGLGIINLRLSCQRCEGTGRLYKFSLFVSRPSATLVGLSFLQCSVSPDSQFAPRLRQPSVPTVDSQPPLWQLAQEFQILATRLGRWEEQQLDRLFSKRDPTNRQHSY